MIKNKKKNQMRMLINVLRKTENSFYHGSRWEGKH